jgi:hypothetical protein
MTAPPGPPKYRKVKIPAVVRTLRVRAKSRKLKASVSDIGNGTPKRKERKHD